MSSAPPNIDPHWLPPEPPRSGCGKKLVMGLGCGCLIMLLCCCGGVFGLAVWATRGLVADPDQVAAAMAEVARIEVPESLKPEGALHWKVPFGQETLLVGVLHTDKETDSMLMLGSGLVFTDEVAKFLQEVLEKGPPSDRRQPLVNTRSEERTVRVKGHPRPFVFTWGQDAQSKQPRLEVQGIFAGKNRPALFVFSGSAEKYPAETIQKMLESIQ